MNVTAPQLGALAAYTHGAHLTLLDGERACVTPGDTTRPCCLDVHVHVMCYAYMHLCVCVSRCKHSNSL